MRIYANQSNIFQLHETVTPCSRELLRLLWRNSCWLSAFFAHFDTLLQLAMGRGDKFNNSVTCSVTTLTWRTGHWIDMWFLNTFDWSNTVSLRFLAVATTFVSSLNWHFFQVCEEKTSTRSKQNQQYPETSEQCCPSKADISNSFTEQTKQPIKGNDAVYSTTIIHLLLTLWCTWWSVKQR